MVRKNGESRGKTKTAKTTKKQPKKIFALYEYSTENVGDEIQSIAARRFIPEVSQYVDRDQKLDFSGNGTVQTKLIMNGWYMHKPQNWPPVTRGIHPLLISMYIDQKNPQTVEAFTSKQSKAFLSKFGPVGARDKATLHFLQSQGVSAYFSGCVTLTLKRDDRFPRGNFVLIVDVSADVERHVRATSKYPVVSLSVYRTPDLSREDKFMLAEYYLYLYQSARAVVTTRLHTMLPCLAFETPVALIKEEGKFEQKRYEGLVELVRAFDERQFVETPSIFDINNPPQNKPAYRALRKKLIERCRRFTGYEADTYLTLDLASMYSNVSFMRLIGMGSAATYRELLSKGDAVWQERVANDTKEQLTITKTQLDNSEKQLNQIYDSLSWKAMMPFRRLERKLQPGEQLEEGYDGQTI